MREQPHFQPGQPIVLREKWQDKILSVRPEIVVQDTPDLMAFYMPEGTIWKRARALDGTPASGKERFRLAWMLTDEKWGGNDRLRLSIPGAHYSVLIFWTSGDWLVLRWYINLEEPLRRTELGFDYNDLLLDIIAVPDLTKWYWRDEDELEEAVSLGIISSARADTLRSEGEKAIAWLQSGKSPFNGWEKWHPDPSWQIPTLPEGWDIID